MTTPEVWSHLEPILKQWCGARLIFPDNNLKSLWMQGPTGKCYDPYGIDSLIGAIQADEFFSPCAAAEGLELGQFQKGGEIQIVDDLIKRLSPCGS